MANDFKIGAGLALDGEAEFKKAISGINKDLTVLGSEMKKVTAQFDGNANSMEALTAKQKVYNDRADEQRKKIDLMSTALENAKKEFGENSDKVKDWQIKLNNAEADLAKTENALNENEQAMKDFGKSADDAGARFEKLGGILKGAAVAIGAVAVAAGAAAVKMGKEVVKQFGELEQNLGGSEAVFGEYAASIQKSGEDAYKNLGVSQSDYLATANKMGALFQGSGIEQQKSLELTEQAMQRAADMASVMGIDMQVALDSVAGAAKGNFTMMDNLGVAMNATSIEAYALSKGIKTAYKDMTQSQKAEVAMQMFFENTQQYAGNFAKESTETISGSIGLLKAAIGSFTAGLGNADADMTNLTGNMVDAFRSVVKNVMPIVQNLTAALPAAFAALMPALKEMLPELLTVITGLFQQVLEMLLEILPELIPVAVDAILTIVDTLIENVDLLVDAAIEIILALALGLVDALPKLAEKVPEIIFKIVSTLIKNLPQIFAAGLNIISSLAEGIINFLGTLTAPVAEIVAKVVRGIKDKIQDVIDVGKDIVRGIWDGIKSMAKWLGDQVSGFFSGIIDNVKSFLGIASPSKVFAGIGANMAAGLGAGFSDQMYGVARQINNSIPTSFNAPQINAAESMGAGIVNGMAALVGSAPGGNYTINLNIDGRTAASVLFDPLRGVIKQKGVVLA